MNNQGSATMNGQTDEHDDVAFGADNGPSTPERPRNLTPSHTPLSPTSSPGAAAGQDSPLSPRILAVQALKRAASVREGNQNGNNNSNGSLARSASQLSSPRIANLGLERSASDAARRMAMAKLTGEKIVAWVAIVCTVVKERNCMADSFLSSS